MITASATDRPRRVFSRFYAKISERMEAEGMTALRAALLDDLAGEVVEIGAGNGLNFAHYPPRVTRVVAVEPEPHLRGLAVRAAAAAPVPVTVVPGTAERLPLPDGSADAAGLRMVQRLADATVWPLLTGGCRTATDPAGLLAAAGFDLTELRRLRFPEARFSQPSTPHVLGTARR